MNRKLSPPVIVAALAVLTLAVLAIAFLQGQPDGPRALPEDRVELNVTTGRYFFSPGTEEPINVTKGSLVVLHVTSTDVTHGLAIQGYGVNEEIPAGQTVTITFRATKEGSFTIYCTVFCGSGHPDHQGTLNVLA